ncbi:alkaline phosphatase D family protein [Novosphingobium album (ex Liu et al. 2023)]|uniref:Alkaline phosphatase D family protein n=1 Tax=Novosphingobium album (ex Liu et al. 2023) TaxID=3031130 RepID=A0ABT5WP66_9SPHN|nr:alkaline phosphatase D family protein [Novosphingobium album (ex Liu et al. 2023)]MDE8651829.1 alkaline phosphatase D family protein [Novosphingobium album (ex Liu et al. 2023)]
MRDTSRRAFVLKVARGGLAGLGLHGAFALHAAGLAGRRHVDEAPRFARDPFSLGVAAGEPEQDGFVIWTRLAPEPLAAGGGMAPGPVLVEWEVAEDEAFRIIVRQGKAIAHPELAHAVHVEVGGLRPRRPYWYRFVAGGLRSPVGRANTLPVAGAPLERLRFVVAGCQHYEEGLYTGWRHIAEEAPDFVFHYGDYIYEGGDAGDRPRLLFGRTVMPVRRHGMAEPMSLDDYRRRYALYKSDADLRAAHAACAFFVSFDDHEVDNNWAGLQDQDGTPPELFALRRAAAFQAFYEHMPLRLSAMPRDGRMRLFRAARYGDLVDAWFLDTRQYRSGQPCGDQGVPGCQDIFAPDRTMLGAAQESWLFDGLASGTARWAMIGQQVLMMNLNSQRDPLKSERQYFTDSWSGFQANRDRLLDHIDRLGLRNVAIVSGDSHLHFVGDVAPGNAPDRVIASEFLATSISSGADGAREMPVTPLWLRNNGQLKMMDARRGYMVCTVDRKTWRSDMRVLDTVERQGGSVSTRASYVLERGERGVKPA